MSRKIDRTGETRTMKNGLKTTITAYRNRRDLDVEFENGGIVLNRPYRYFVDGIIECPMIIKNMGDYSEVTNPNVVPNAVFLMDNDDLYILGDSLWCLNRGYAKNSKRGMLLHRIIMNAKPNEFVDHRDGNRADNRKSNLRMCTRSGNAKNSARSINNSSEYKGVHWHKRDKKWYVEIGVDYRSIFIGSFDDKVEAAKAYNEAAIKYHGEFARLNVI